MFKSCFGLYISVFRNTLVAHKSLEKSCFTGFTVLKEIIIRFWNVQFQKEFSTPQDFGSGEFLCIFLKENVIK